jgi:hypothetical protein
MNADDEVPYFCWDRRLTRGELRRIAGDPRHPEHLPTLGLLLREARPDEVWTYVDPQTIARELPAVARFLGRRAAFWSWLIEGWRSLGLLPREPDRGAA